MAETTSLSLGSLLFERYCDGEKYENTCYLTRNLFSDKRQEQKDRSSEINEPDYTAQCNGVDDHHYSQDELVTEQQSEKEELPLDNDRESLLIEAQKKYIVFEEQCSDILDPNRNDELQLMKSLGLPTMLINNHADMEEEEQDDDDGCHRNRKRQNHKGKKIPVVTESNGEQESSLITDKLDSEKDEESSQLSEETQNTIIDTEEIPGLVTNNIQPYSHSVDDMYREELASNNSSINNDDVELNAEDYNIDWTEVEEGKAAGIPGHWERVPQTGNDSLSDTIGEDLCDALRIKAAAYSDETWQYYWCCNGPFILAQQWKQLHPRISLKQVEVISGLGFLCVAMETMMSLGGCTENINDITQMNTSTDHTQTDTIETIQLNTDVEHTQTDTIETIQLNTDVEHTLVDTNTDHTQTDTIETIQLNTDVEHNLVDTTTDHTQTDTPAQQRINNSTCSTFNDDQVLSLWNTFYNEIYWSNYNQFMSHSKVIGSQQTEVAENTDDIIIDKESVVLSQQDDSTVLDVENKVSRARDNKMINNVKLKCHHLGLAIGDNVGCNPHERALRRVFLKLNKIYNTGCNQKVFEAAISNVDENGILYRGKIRKGGKNKWRRRRRKSKKANKNGDLSQEDEGEESQNEMELTDTQNNIDTDTNQNENVSDTNQNENVSDTNQNENMTDTNQNDTVSDTNQNEIDTDANQNGNVSDANMNVTDTNQNENESDTNQNENESNTNQSISETVTIAIDSPVQECSSVNLCLQQYAGQSLVLSELAPPTAIEPIGIEMVKYWGQRYRLFSKYDQGVCLDNEGWFSATPEKIAIHLAERCQCDIIVDGFCGVGSNAIQFAFTCERVIAIDIDPVKIACAKHNAIVYGVQDRIEFIVGDFFQIVPHLKCVDVIFLSPPWGGPGYLTSNIFNLQTMVPIDGLKVFQVAKTVTPHIAYYLPRNIAIDQLVLMADQSESIEVEQQFLNRRLKTITAYYGELINY